VATTITPNMNLPVPVVGVEPGPNYALDINACMAVIDAHTHTTGSGTQITPAGLDLNSDVSFQSNNAISLRSVRFAPNSGVLVGIDDNGAIYQIQNDLYYNDASGTPIRITQNGALAGTPGSIANLVAPASASFVALSGTFVWQQAANTAANMDFAAATLRNDTVNGKGVTLLPATALGADYTITLPTLPASQKIMTLDATGIMSAPYTVDSSTIEVSSNVIQVKNNGITDAKLRQSGPRSVIGRSASSTGNVADIQAAADGQILKQSGDNTTGSLVFDYIATSSLYNKAVTSIKLGAQNGAGSSASSGSRTGTTSFPGSDDIQATINVQNDDRYISLVCAPVIGSTADISLGKNSGVTGLIQGRVAWYIDGSLFSIQNFGQADDSGLTAGLHLPPNAFSTMTQGGLTIGSHTIGLRFAPNLTSTTIGWTNVRILAIEL
jgi:hypothetical protein